MLDIPHAAAAPPACFVSPASALAPPDEREHLVLVKRLAHLQQHMTLLVTSYETQLRLWQHKLMRQSVRLMLERTRADWGLVPHALLAGAAELVAATSVTEPAEPGLAQALASAQTDALICLTGCQMDGDHWRDGEWCKRSGRACAVVVPRMDESET